MQIFPYKQIHTPTVVQGGGVDGPPPLEFLICCTILPSVEGLWCSLQDEEYFMADGAAGGPVTSPKNDHHLGLYQELEIKLKTREMVIFCAWEEK